MTRTLLNGTTWNKNYYAFKCGSCEMYCTVTQLKFHVRNPVLTFGGHMYLCPNMNCNCPVFSVS